LDGRKFFTGAGKSGLSTTQINAAPGSMIFTKVYHSQMANSRYIFLSGRLYSGASSQKDPAWFPRRGFLG